MTLNSLLVWIYNSKKVADDLPIVVIYFAGDMLYFFDICREVFKQLK